MKLFKVSLCAAVATLAMAGAASAAEVTFNAGVSNAYVFRGLKQTTGDCCNETAPQVFGGADLTAGQFYAGTWLSNVGPTDEDGLEYDIYAGFKPTLGPVSLDIGVIYYGYKEGDVPFPAVTDTLNTTEFKLAGSIAAGPATLGAAAYYTDDAAGSGDEATYLELNASVPFRGATVSGAIGQVKSDSIPGAPDSYMTWNVGVTVPVSDKFSVDARYIGTDDDAFTAFGNGAVGDTFVATLKVTL